MVFRFLTLAVADRPDRTEALRRLRLTEADWICLPDAAERHGVASWTTAALEDLPEAPAGVREALASARRASALRALRGTSELLQIAQAMEQRGIEAVALKGPAFSQWLYGDAGIRSFGDLDLLVAADDLSPALAALVGLGYRLPAGMSPRSARAIYGGLGAYPLGHPAAFPVDLHWRLAHARFALPLAARAVIDASGTVPLGGRHVRIPAPTHAAMFALQHAAKHLWCSLEILVAIAALMRRTDVDWRAVRDLARAGGCWHGCATGLRLAAELPGATVPAVLANEPWPAASDALIEEARAALALPAGKFQDRWIERRAHRAAFDAWPARVRYDLWRLFAPTPLEWDWCPLPDRLTPLYVPLRLVRLGVAAARGGLRSAAGTSVSH